MTTEREEALELAREAGLKELFGWRDRHECGYYFEGWPEHVEKLVRLAKQRGAEEQKRKDVEICRSGKCNRPDDHPANFFDGGLEHCAQAIEGQP